MVVLHPSLRVLPTLYGLESPDALTAAVCCPTLLLPASNDPENVKPGGSTLAILASKDVGAHCASIECTSGRCCFCHSGALRHCAPAGLARSQAHVHCACF